MLGVWLEYGLDPRNSLVHIADAPERGRTSLRCPYCLADLIARKGSQVAWHFAHEGETCAPSMRRDDAPSLPLYRDFTLGLTPREADILRVIDAWGHADDARLVSRLAGRGLCQWNPYRGRGGGYELTKLGKIPLGKLSLYLFSQVQESLISSDLEKLHKRVKSGDSLALPDLRIFRAQVRRIHANTLYFLEVTASSALWKIGVTTRPIDERVREIESDLRQWLPGASVRSVLGTWPGKGGIEPYFKFKYRASNFRVGPLTEYFALDDAKAVLRDLGRLEDRS